MFVYFRLHSAMFMFAFPSDPKKIVKLIYLGTRGERKKQT